MLDFFGLQDTYSEKDLENAILAELEKFILEMGTGLKRLVVACGNSKTMTDNPEVSSPIFSFIGDCEIRQVCEPKQG